ncbi:MAG: BNR-4 repeat-containing protein, partial [Flavisolibacter sp.]
PDVASNHDLCYARSKDGGITWEKSTGEKYHLPITAATAEIACHIAQNSELINQTSMFADASGNPYIATYWRDRNDLVPQYHLVCKRGLTWQLYDPGFRKTDFSLSGAGTKQVPVSRPQVIAWTSGNRQIVGIIFRDAERNNRPSIAICTDLEKAKWKVTDFDQNSLGSWEPTYDTELWKTKSELHLFLQKTEQVDAEGQSDLPPQMVRVLEWKPVSKN